MQFPNVFVYLVAYIVKRGFAPPTTNVLCIHCCLQFEKLLVIYICRVPVYHKVIFVTVRLPLCDRISMIYTLESRKARNASASTRLRHGVNINYFFDTGM